MPGSDSDSSSSEDFDLTEINWADFPLSPNSVRTLEVGQALLSLRQQFRQLSQRIARTSTRREPINLSIGPHPQQIFFESFGDPTGSTAEVQSASEVPIPMPTMNTAQREPKKTVVTLATALPPTSYNEQDEADDAVRTLAYVKVQRALLKYQDKYAADTLTDIQARKWTQSIDPDGRKQPTAADALKLCYYMRSQGYDVYANVKDKLLMMYLVTAQDLAMLYWVQDLQTNKSFELDLGAPRGSSRRNAVTNVEEALRVSRETPVAAHSAGNAELSIAQAELQALLEEEETNPE
jgi:hypothetical protein